MVRCFSIFNRAIASLSLRIFLIDVSICLFATPFLLRAEIIELPELVTVGRRYPQYLDNSPNQVTVLGRENFEHASQRRLDGVLKQVPGFSLFRRNSSRVAHPSIQGVSLRNLGPTASSRTLVLLDGIPLNDPFGGWVYWNRLPLALIDRVEIQTAGGAGQWGNYALGGVIHVFSRLANEDYGIAEVSVGNRGTSELLFSIKKHVGDFAFSINANRFSTEGYPVLRTDQRGSVDIDAYSKSDLLDLGFEWKLPQGKTLSARASRYYEKRGNGTILTENDTEAYDANLALRSGDLDDNLHWRAQIYFQKRTFRNLFSSVAQDRVSERPALEQFDVPAEAWGSSLVISFTAEKGHHILVGIDARTVEGKTRERFRFVDGSFLKEREAGGRQSFFGIFLEDIWQITSGLRLHASGRVDYFHHKNGLRLEKDAITGATLRDERFMDRQNWIGNFRIGINAEISVDKRAYFSVYSGFRIPTLNELYRPFRVKNDITEANPALLRERLFGAELGFEWAPADATRFRINIFSNDIENAVANVHLAPGPGIIEPCGFVPPGGSCRQRRNLDKIRVAGFELISEFNINDNWRISAGYLYNDAKINESLERPILEGKRLAQTPEHSARVSLDWLPSSRWRSSLQIQFNGDQFEDDGNQRRLGAFTVLNFSTSYLFGENTRVFATIENLLDTEFEIGKASSGIVSIGAPFLASVGMRHRF